VVAHMIFTKFSTLILTLVVQNCAIAVAMAGHHLVSRPALSPDLAPIETVFKHVKEWLRARVHILNSANLVAFIRGAVLAVTPAQCDAAFAHCGHRV
jgi:transposase